MLVAPLAGTAFNMGKGLPEERFAREWSWKGPFRREHFLYRRRHVQSVRQRAERRPAAEGWGIPVIKPWAGEAFFERLERVAQAGCRVAGMDIDTAAITALAKSKRPVSPKSRAELSAIVEKAHALGLKFMLKGVLSVEDALAAEECGCDAIVVSNHGGRAAEAVPARLLVLPPSPKACAG